MGGITRMVSNLASTALGAVGLTPSSPTINISNATAPTPAAAATQAAGPYTSAADAAQQQMAAGAARGTSSTLLNGTDGVDPDKLQTSKVLLGQ